MPGRMPMPMPISDERKALGIWPKNSLSEKPKPLTFFILKGAILVLCAARPVSAILITSATANIPIITVSMAKPPLRLGKSKVKRRIASTGAMPTVEKAKPRAPEKMPLTSEPVDRVAIRVREKMAMEKYSWGPKRKAALASQGAMENNAAMLSRVPMKENTMPMPRALMPSPLSIIGPPSKVVAMEAGVPGIFSRIAEIKPPEVAPMNSATNSDRPAAGPMV
ncbi:hypothetical protein D9M68_796040 [compost metagenome]